jgi:hypothetical protein
MRNTIIISGIILVVLLISIFACRGIISSTESVKDGYHWAILFSLWVLVAIAIISYHKEKQNVSFFITVFFSSFLSPIVCYIIISLLIVFITHNWENDILNAIVFSIIAIILILANIKKDFRKRREIYLKNKKIEGLYSFTFLWFFIFGAAESLSGIFSMLNSDFIFIFSIMTLIVLSFWSFKIKEIL